jgi:hypothetical protein
MNCINLRKSCKTSILSEDVLPYSALWYAQPNGVANPISYAKFRSRSHNAVIRVYDAAGNVIETHEQLGEFQERWDERKSRPHA